jgi:hypothetical protein
MASPAAAPSQPFTDDEWRLLRVVVGRFERPVSFQHVHDALRDARNNAGIVRTNEELRSLIKQAINSGMLERSGKGNRASYRLAPQAAELEAPEAVAVEAPDQAEVIAPPVEERAEPPEAEQQPEFYTPEAAAQAEMIAAVAEPETPAEVAPAASKRSRRKPAAEAQAAPAKPARSTRKKAAPAAQAAPPPEAAEQAKPKRPRRKKAETTE